MIILKYLTYLSITLLLIFSCSKEEEKLNNTRQEEMIEKYVSSLEGANVIFNDIGVWKIIENEGNNNIIAKPGDSIFFYYAAYIFSNGKGKIYDTNVKEIAIENNFNVDFNLFEIRKEVIGRGKLIKGMDIGLIGSKKNEESVIIYSAKNGFGDKQIGLIPKSSAHYVEVWIKDIKQK